MDGCIIPNNKEPWSRDGSMKYRKEEIEEGPSSEFLAKYGRTVKFDVSSRPVPQGSMRAFVVNNKPILTSTSKGLKDWRRLVMSEAQRHISEHFDGPVAITLHFRLPKPKSAPKKRRTLPDKRPDLDKLVRAVLDALTHVIMIDDSQVVALTATKDYGSPPGVSIQVDEIAVL